MTHTQPSRSSRKKLAKKFPLPLLTAKYIGDMVDYISNELKHFRLERKTIEISEKEENW